MSRDDLRLGELLEADQLHLYQDVPDLLLALRMLLQSLLELLLGNDSIVEENLTESCVAGFLGRGPCVSPPRGGWDFN